MSRDIEAPLPAKSPPLVPYLRAARFDDYENIRRLVLAHGFDFPTSDDWHRLWLDNPLWASFGKECPIGWVLETRAGEIVGSLGTTRSRYSFRGDDLISAVARGWFVTAPYRGFALHLMDKYFSQPGVDLFINTTPSANAIPSFSQLSARIPLGDWETISYCIPARREFAQRAFRKLRLPLAGLLAYPASGALSVMDAVCGKPLPAPPRSVIIETADRFDSRFDDFWDELVRQNPNKLLAGRSSRALSWHFGIPMRRGGVWIFTASRSHQLRAYCVLMRQSSAPGVRRMRLVDYQSIEQELDLLPAFVHAALQRCSAEGYYILENLGAGVPKMRAFDRFAPYRKKLPNWTFFYRAADPGVDAELRDPRFWDPSAYDGDASLE